MGDWFVFILIIIAIIIFAYGRYLMIGVAGGMVEHGPKPGKPAKPNTYCTLVMKGDAYVPGAMALGESLRRNCPGTDSICMVTDDVSAEARAALARVFTHVRLVPYINHPSRTASKRQEELYSAWMSSSFTKWNLLDFTDYGTVMFMDADTVAVEDLAPLFRLPMPAICMGSPWMKPWARFGLDNAMGRKRHGERVPSAQVWRQLRTRSSGMMGGLVMLQPVTGATDKLRAMLARYKVFPPHEYQCMASADEQAIAQLMLEMDQTWTNLGNRYNYMVGKTEFLEGQQPAVRHYYHNKPWDYPRTHWAEYETWYGFVDSLTAREPDLKKWFPKA